MILPNLDSINFNFSHKDISEHFHLNYISIQSKNMIKADLLFHKLVRLESSFSLLFKNVSILGMESRGKKLC